MFGDGKGEAILAEQVNVYANERRPAPIEPGLLLHRHKGCKGLLLFRTGELSQIRDAQRNIRVPVHELNGPFEPVQIEAGA
jgi:hypothetical protein